MNRRWRWILTVVAWNAALGLSTSGATGQSCRQWQSPLPSPRYGPALAFDSTRSVTVMFGGFTGVGSQGSVAETWEWNGSDWSLRASDGPAERLDHAMTFDSARGVVVMFGGRNSHGPLRDTWEWNGESWMLRSLTGPAPAAGHAMAYDPVRQVTVMCGAGGGTWEWNGQVWTLRVLGAPANRNEHSMVYDDIRERMILFGGSTGSGETWEWSGEQGTWTLLAATGPGARRGHAMAYDSERGIGLMHGGLSTITPGFYYDDTWEWNSRDGAWQECRVGSTRPARRIDAAMAYDAARHEVMLFGGRRAARFGDTWVLDSKDPKSWSAISPYPSRIWDAPIAYDSGRKVTVGLFSPTNSGPAETWEWDGNRWTQSEVLGPSIRAGARMVFDSLRGVVVLFGGAAQGSSAPLGDTWEFDGEAWTMVANTGPPARWYHSMAFDEKRGVTVLFGGTISNLNGFSDTWEWDGRGWTQRFVAGPSPRRLSGMAYDRHRNVVVLFGGSNYNPPNVTYTDTWEWDGQTWTQWPFGNPPLGSDAVLAFDDRRGVIVLTDSSASDPNGAAWWERDGVLWSTFQTSATISGSNNAMTYDSARGRIVLFGGYDDAQTWEFGVVTGCPADVNGDGRVDVLDLLAIINAWGPCKQSPCVGDANDDGAVNDIDLSIVIGGWGS